MPRVPPQPAPKPRLTRDDWTSAALEVIAQRGLDALAVEPLATQLGATKGSFYWHFKNRGALIEAALARWESDDTEAVIARVEREPDPRKRPRLLLGLALGSVQEYREISEVELALLARAQDPLVAPVIARVTARRLAYLTDLFGSLGLAPKSAKHRAWLAYSAYIGHLQLVHTAPDSAPTPTEHKAYLDHAIAALLSDVS